MSPSRHQQNGDAEPDRPTYPELAEEIGEDPARFLYSVDPMPRIRGLETIAKVEAYLRVEAENEARKRVIAALNQRKADLKARNEDAGVLETADHDPSPNTAAGAPVADGDGGGLAGDPEAIAAALSEERAQERLDEERAKDDPDERIVEALEKRLEGAL